MKREIEFIFFDLGKVLVHFDHQICCENVSRLTGIAADQVQKLIFKSGLQSDYETGKIDSDQYVDRFNHAAKTRVDQRLFLDAVSDIFALNRQMVPVLTQLKMAGFPMGVLSNTCEAHWEFILRNFPIVESIFSPETCVLSFRVGSMKPNIEIYEKAIEVTGTSPESIFFTDDLRRNVDGATSAEITARQFTSTPQLIRDFARLNIRVNV